MASTALRPVLAWTSPLFCNRELPSLASHDFDRSSRREVSPATERYTLFIQRCAYSRREGPGIDSDKMHGISHGKVQYLRMTPTVSLLCSLLSRLILFYPPDHRLTQEYRTLSLMSLPPRRHCAPSPDPRLGVHQASGRRRPHSGDQAVEMFVETLSDCRIPSI